MSNLLLFPLREELPPQPPDAAVRAEALDIHRSFIVQAPAGSGKTALLIQRFLKLLADESVLQPEQVLAITFTNAATAELRDRVIGYLEKAQGEYAQAEAGPIDLAASESTHDFDRVTLDLAHDVISRDAALGWQLLTHPHRLNIRTIDSVCAEIARTLPVLSGSGGALRPVEEAGPLYREAARRTLLELGRGNAAFDAALRDLLLHRDGNLDDCESLLAEMLALRDQWGELLWGNLVPIGQAQLDDAWLDANVLPRLERALQHAISSTLARLDAIFPADLLHELADVAGNLGRLPGTNGDTSPIACCAGVHDPPEALAAHLEHWSALIHLLVTAGGGWRKGLAPGHLKFELDKSHPCRAQLARILDQLSGRDDLLDAFKEVSNLPPACYPADQWAVAKSLFRVLSRSLVELQLVFAERDRCDFTELSLLARSALRNGSGSGDLASALGSRLQHLLVDEMQDTSTGQYELLELLTASWDGHSQTVFLVGDPYQSIYLFRQARVERFVEALESGQLGELPLTRLALTANFRSQRALVHQFNEDFDQIFTPHADRSRTSADGLHFLQAHATQPPSSASGRVWHANPQPRTPKAAAHGPFPSLVPTQAHRDADSIAQIAADWLQRPLPAGRNEPWRIAVLVRSRSHLAAVIPALRRADLSFRAVDIETLHDRQEVLDLTALTRALLHPGDRTAALAVLRAPWCGLSLADMHTLTGADDSTFRQHSLYRLIDERAHLLPADSQQRVRRVQEVLRSSIRIRSRVTTAQLVERAWRSLGGDAPLTPAEFTNARRFFELLDTLEASTGRVDPAQLEDRLTHLFAEPDPLPANTAFVELLTIHKAKGLEWDLVFVPALERSPAGSPSRLLTWSVLDDLTDPAVAHILLAPIAARGEEVDPLTRWIKRRYREREYAENKRLFYVACTRARQELHLFAAPALTRNGVSPGYPDTLLHAAWPAAEPHFANIPATHSATELPPTEKTDSSSVVLELAAGGQPEEVASLLDINYLEMPHQVVDETLLPALYPVIRRLPLSFDPAARLAEAPPFQLPPNEPIASDRAPFVRPEGSFAARSFGNTVHSLIELLTARIASGATAAQLLHELPSWSSRIAALLRADGLAASTVSRLARESRAALENLLRDPDGQWLLALHAEAASEFSLTVPSGSGMITVRADRIFRAGPQPLAPGDTHLWIVDYKTASHSGANVEEFLRAQRTAYAPQLEAYARTLAPAQGIAPENVRLALYFPALREAPRLTWWALNAAAEPESATVPDFELRTEN